MKKFSLKKITAAVSAAAMIATMGTTAFAHDITVANGNTGISILDEDHDGIYDITVNYTSAVENKIGVTMLTYGMTDNTGLTAQTANKAYDKEKMKIVGVDQSAPVAANGSGTFSFRVSAILPKAGSANTYYLKRGVPALIALSGDGVTDTTPNYQQIELPGLTATSATMTEASVPVNYYYGDNDEAILAAVKSAITGKKVNVAAVGTAKDKENNPLESYTATYTLAGTEEVTKENNTYSVTIPNTATFDADSADASCIAIPTDGIKAEIPVTLTAKAWTGTGLALKEGVTSVSINKKDIASDDTYATKAVKKALEDILYITDTANNRSAKVTNVLADGVITVEKTGAAQYDSTSNGEQDLTFKVTAANAQSVKENTESEVIATLESGTIETLNVKVKALEDGEFFVKDVKALKNGAEVTIPDQAYGADLQGALESALTDAEIWVYGEDAENENEKWTLASGKWTITGYDSTVETEQPSVTAKKKIVAPENSKGKIDSENDIELTFIFKVLAKPQGTPITLGDVDGNGKIDFDDYGVVEMHFSNKLVVPEFGDKTTWQFAAANADDSNEKIDFDDYGVFEMHFSNKLINNDFGTKAVGTKPVE
jgi:hypothetical protein